MSRFKSWAKVSKIQVSDPITMAYRKLVSKVLLYAVNDWYKTACPDRELARQRLEEQPGSVEGGIKEIFEHARGYVGKKDARFKSGFRPIFSGPAQELSEFFYSDWCYRLYEFVNIDYRQAMRAIKLEESE